MHVRRYPLMDAAGQDGQLPGGAPAASAPAAAPAPSPADSPAAAPSPAAAGAPSPDGASGGGAPAAGSLLARGAAAPATGSAPAAAPAGDGDKPPVIPEKYQVKNEDGSINWEASALKQAQGYQHLAQRLGSDAPPKTVDDYAPELPQGMTMDALKQDPLFAGFLKGAHSKGMTNAQVSYILGEFQQRVQMLNEQRADPELAAVELQKVWTVPGEFDKGLSNAYRGAKAFAVDAEHAQRLEQKFGSDPDFIRLMAKVGAELGEDVQPAGLNGAEAETLESLLKHPAYFDAKHPEHAAIVAKTRVLYAKKTGGR